MAISKKTRKILWALSGNRCALCRQELIVEKTVTDAHAVVGDECHIVSPKGRGPRYDPSVQLEQLDLPENLLLLCRVHHKEVDDQPNKYSVARLNELKKSHEAWFKSTRKGEDGERPIRIVKIKERILESLPRISTAREIMNLVEGSLSYETGHPEDLDGSDSDLVGDFFQTIKDYGDIA